GTGVGGGGRRGGEHDDESGENGGADRHGCSSIALLHEVCCRPTAATCGQRSFSRVPRATGTRHYLPSMPRRIYSEPVDHLVERVLRSLGALMIIGVAALAWRAASPLIRTMGRRALTRWLDRHPIHFLPEDDVGTAVDALTRVTLVLARIAIVVLALEAVF